MKKNIDDLISIIVPVYNVEKYLKRCLDSIINQTYKNLEIICVDDGSKDSSGKILDDYKLKDKRIKVYHIKNGGVSHARNLGISKATGKYIGFVDSDDYIEPNMFEELYNSIIENKSDISVCNFWHDYEDKKENRMNTTTDIISETMCRKEYINSLFRNNFYCFMCNKLYISKLAKKIKFDLNLSILEDVIYNIEYAKYVEKASYVNECLYHYVQRNTSVTHNVNRKVDYDLYLAKGIANDMLEDYNIESLTYLKLDYIIESIIYMNSREIDKDEKDRINKYIKKYLKQGIFFKKGYFKYKLKAVIALLFPKLYVKIRYR